MIIIEYIKFLFTDYTLQIIALGTAVLGAVCGVLGSFAVLRKQSLLGDAISHAALPGIVIAFLISFTKDNNVLLIGALLSGLAGTLLINGITKRTHLKTDTAIGVVLSVFFGFGMLLLTYVQKIPDANQSGLDKYLFGQAATLMQKDVILLSIVFVLSLIIVFVFWKELKVMLFDVDYAKTIGINTGFLNLLITFFIVLAIVLGLQTVGVVLMSAMLLSPAAAARQWTNKLGTMLILAAFIGAFSGVSGTIISDFKPNLATGPVIVIVSVSIVIISFLFAPKRGILFNIWGNYKNKGRFDLNILFLRLYYLIDNDKEVSYIEENIIHKELGNDADSFINKMIAEGWIIKCKKSWEITPKGRKFAQKLINETLRTV